MTAEIDAKVDYSLQALLRKQHGDIQVIIERQSEINRRIGVIETEVKAQVIRMVKLEDTTELLQSDMESDDSRRDGWWERVIGTAITVFVTLGATWLASKVGIPILGGP